MADHTPGPWRVRPSLGRDSLAIFQADGRTLARTRTAFEDGDEAINAANARLIAAAPDLLAALRIVAEELDRATLKGPSGRPTVAALNRMAEAARAAIAKAEG